MSETIRLGTHCLCGVHGNHVDCDQVCTMTTGCFWPIRPVPPLPDPIPRNDRWMIEPIRSEEETRYHYPRRLQVLPDLTEVGPALHETQARAYALIAAAQLRTGENWTPQSLAFWRHHVMSTADIFTQYITTGQHKPTPSGSEDS